jgi:hypothetical protein
MNGPMLNKVLPVTLALASVFALGGAKAMQQSPDPGQAAGQRPAHRRTD